MAEIVQNAEGSARVEYQIALPEKKFLTFDETKVQFSELNMVDTVTGAGTAKHIFRTNDPSFLSVLKTAMAGADPILRFRLGYGSPANTYWLPWQEHVVAHSYAKFEGIGTSSGHLVVLDSVNTFRRMRSVKVLARKGKISDMAAAIAKDAGMECVAEETEGDFILVQSYTTDVAFLMSRALPRAINKQGVGGYLCFIRDNVLHFHTVDYQTTVKRIDYYRAYGSGFEATDNSQSSALWDNGLAGATVVAYDPATGDSKEIQSKPDKAVKFAEGLYAFDSMPGAKLNIPYHLSANPVAEMDALAQSAYQDARRRVFRNTLVLRKTISLRHGDLLDITLAQQEDRTSDYSGYHLVSAASHTIKKGQAISVYTLERGETQPQRGSTVVQDKDQQLAAVNRAPGQKLNVAEIQSSERTKGAGNSTSAKTFRVVADAATGKAS